MRIQIPNQVPVLQTDAYNYYLPQYPDGVSFRLEQGQLVPQNKPLFPQYYLNYEQLLGALPEVDEWHSHDAVFKFFNWSDDIAQCPIPFEIVGDQMFTDSRWFGFSLLIGPWQLQNKWQKVWAALEEGHIHCFDVCPVYQQDLQSYIGQLIHLFGWKSWPYFEPSYDHPADSFQAQLCKVVSGYSLEQLLSKETDQSLQEFRDQHYSLLDLASRYQLWDLAHFLWNKGVRWTQHYLHHGLALRDLSVGCAKLFGEEWLFDQPGVEEKYHQRDAHWLKLWLNRYHHDPDRPSNLPILLEDECIVLAPHSKGWMAHGDLIWWTEHMRFNFCNQDKLSDFLLIWVCYWKEQGIDFHDLTLTFPSHIHAYGFGEYMSELQGTPIETIKEIYRLNDHFSLQQQTPLVEQLQDIRRL